MSGPIRYWLAVGAVAGPTASVSFDSGYEAWAYRAPADREHYLEFVILIDPHGVAKKTRSAPQRQPSQP
jgi:hypothetical protein